MNIRYDVMSEASHPIVQILRDDPRYKIEAYQFVRDALHFAQESLQLGGEPPSLEESDPDDTDPEMFDEDSGERHLTGQQLCEAIRRYALEQYGYLARVVLNSWGVKCTGDFGEIVYNLIEAGLMKKSPTDERTDFDDQYDFEHAFEQEFRITVTHEDESV